MANTRRQMNRDLNSLLSDAARSFEQFRRQRNNIAWMPKLSQKDVRAAEGEGEAVGAAFNHGMKSAIEKVDATLRFGAEALGRIAAYRDRILGQEGAAERGAGRGAPARDGKADALRAALAAQANPAAAQAASLIGTGAAGMGLLGQIARNTGIMRDKRPVNIVAAGL